MSQENVEIVTRSVKLWNDEDWEAFASDFDPNVVVVPPEGWPDGEVSVGREPWIRQSIRLKEPWDMDEMHCDQARDVGDSVLVRLHWTTTGKGSGIAVQTEMWGVYTLLARKIVRVAFFLERSCALEAVGLPEQDR
jgi:hypothetical protein